MHDKFKKIVCPVDFSKSSVLALQTALEFANVSQGKVALAHIVHDPWSDLYANEKEAIREPGDAEKRAEEMLKKFAKEHSPSLNCDIFVKSILDGDPWRGIVDFSRFYGADLVIMAKGGGTGISSSWNFAENIMKWTHCSFFLIRSYELIEQSVLDDKLILVVDDEIDILESVGELLSMCRLHKCNDYKSALEKINNNKYDIVILDIMGVNGFSLLERCVELGFPAVMLSAHSITPEAIKKSIQLGAVFFLPKERMADLPAFLEQVVIGHGKPIWASGFERLSHYFERRLGRDWEKTKKLLGDLEKNIT